jgi:hypothetical protein
MPLPHLVRMPRLARHQGTVDRLAPIVYAAVDFLVLLAPALALQLAAARGGLGGFAAMDLVLASAVLGALHATVAGVRLRNEERIAVRRADMWIAAVDGLVVLAIGATALLFAFLIGFPDEQSSLVDRGYPVISLWVGIQLLAIGLAELTARFVFWWLEPHEGRWRPGHPLRRPPRA